MTKKNRPPPDPIDAKTLDAYLTARDDFQFEREVFAEALKPTTSGISFTWFRALARHAETRSGQQGGARAEDQHCGSAVF